MIVIDCGGSFSRFGIWENDILDDVKKIATPSYLLHPDKSIEQLQNLWLDFICKNIADYKNQNKVSIGFAGPVLHDGSLLFSPNIWGNDKKILPISIISKKINMQCHIVNDISAAITRYGYDKKYQKYNRIMLITISTGLGSKIFDIHNKCVLNDDSGRGGEIGQLRIDNIYSPTAQRCFSGTLEQYISGPGITRLAKICSTNKNLHELRTRHLLELCYKKNSDALRIINIATELLAQVIQIIMLSALPNKIILMGGVLKDHGELFKDMLITTLEQLNVYGYSNTELIDLFELGYQDDYSGLIGAGLSFQHLSIGR